MTSTLKRGARLAKWFTVIMLSQVTAAGTLWLALSVLFPEHIWVPAGWSSATESLSAWVIPGAGAGAGAGSAVGSASAMWVKAAIMGAAAVVTLLPALVGAMLVYDRPQAQR